MLIIGILIGTSAAVVWSKSAVRTEEGDASTAARFNGGEALEIPETNTDSIAPSTSDFPLPPSVPDNSRIGLTVLDQPAGKTVTVGGLSIVGKKWVAVYDDQNGKPGWILGARRVHEGDTDALVELIRPEGTTAGQVYYAAILNDDGDDEFNRLTDLPPLASDKVTIVRFRAR